MNSIIYLPLYSIRDKKVPPKSGINQWNASGRDRAFGEAYIPVPIAIRREFSTFFPKVDSMFRLLSPTGKTFNAKLCQQDGKALMTNPNRGICDWLFRRIDITELASRKRQIAKIPYTYNDLLEIGIDSVSIEKIQDGDTVYYKLMPANVGSYELFINQKLIQ